VSTKLARFMRCDPTKFTFDFSTVKSTNYKADATQSKKKTALNNKKTKVCAFVRLETE
jgi:hypothetical protein